MTQVDYRPLLERHLGLLRTHMRGHANAKLLRQEPVSDLVQSVVVEVLADAQGQSFQDEAAFRRWLWRVATNKILAKNRYWSAQRRDRGRVQELDDAAQADDIELAPAAQAERAEDLERLSSALDSLDDELREVLVLRRIFDVPPSVVAQELGIAESTVRWRTAQALAHLATRLRAGAPDKEPA